MVKIRMRIHIVGASGSGKTYLSKKLSNKYGIPAYALDDLFWDNSAGGYSKKREEGQRNQMLRKILSQENWIIEGVQHTWAAESFEKADRVYCLETPPLLCRFRILRRFLVRKCRGTNQEGETLGSVLRLLKWTKKFYRVNFPEIRKMLEQYGEKVVYLKGKSQIRKHIS